MSQVCCILLCVTIWYIFDLRNITGAYTPYGKEHVTIEMSLVILRSKVSCSLSGRNDFGWRLLFLYTVAHLFVSVIYSCIDYCLEFSHMLLNILHWFIIATAFSVLLFDLFSFLKTDMDLWKVSLVPCPNHEGGQSNQSVTWTTILEACGSHSSVSAHHFCLQGLLVGDIPTRLFT